MDREFRKLPAAAIVLTASVAFAACTPTTTTMPVPPSSPTPAASATSPAEPPVETAVTETFAFGSTAAMEFQGSVWAVRIDVPVEAPGLVESFPLSDPATRYVIVPGAVARITGPPADPFAEMSVGVVVDDRGVAAQWLLRNGPVPALPEVGELFEGGQAPFEEVFIVPAGSPVPTVSVVLGSGDGARRVFFGAEPNLGTGASSGQDVQAMKDIWAQATADQRAQSLEDWGAAYGEPVSDAAVAALIRESSEIGVILDEAEAREFLEWAVAG